MCVHWVHTSILVPKALLAFGEYGVNHAMQQCSSHYLPTDGIKTKPESEEDYENFVRTREFYMYISYLD